MSKDVFSKYKDNFAISVLLTAFTINTISVLLYIIHLIMEKCFNYK